MWKLRYFVDLYGQTHRNIQQNQGGSDKPCNVTMQIDISFVYFRFFLLFCVVIAKDLGFKSVLYFSILCCHFLPWLEINVLHKVQKSQFKFIKPLERWYYQCPFLCLLWTTSGHWPFFSFLYSVITSVFLFLSIHFIFRYLCCEVLYCLYVTAYDVRKR